MVQRHPILLLLALLAGLGITGGVGAHPLAALESAERNGAPIGSGEPAPAPSESEDESSEEPTTLLDAFQRGTFGLALRYRWEHVEDDLPAVAAKDADASTLRTALSFTTLPWRRLQLGVEVEDVSPIGNDELYANGGAGSLDNGVRDRPVVADPDLTEVNQAWLGVLLPRNTTLRLGRQALAHGNERFLGAVGWRQNHQSFDAVALEALPSPSFSLEAAWLDRVHTITGAEQPLDGLVFDFGWRTTWVRLGGYGYLLDYERPAQAALSTSTYGLRFAGAHDAGERLQWLYELDVADQSDRGDHPSSDLSLTYGRLELGARLGSATLRAGFESLEGDGRFGFRTPLATLHKFNGWADRFLATPTDGLEELWIRFDLERGRFQLRVDAMRFDAERTGAHYGDELDAELRWSTGWSQLIALKLAFYDADELSADVAKAMLYTAWSF